MNFNPKDLTDSDLELCLREMRARGWVCAVYDASAVSELIARNDVAEEEIESWLQENHNELEQALCQGMYDAIEAQWPPEEESES